MPRLVAGPLALGALMSALGLLGAACSAPREEPRELRIAVAYSLSNLDPHARNTVSAYELLSSVYEGLTTLGKDLRVRPCLAASWANPDELTWVFHLRPNVEFHDGRPLTADDVVHSLQRLLDEETLEVRSYLASVEEVSSPDPTTVVVRTRWPNAQLASRLHYVLIVPGGSTTESLASSANGTGAYAVESWSMDEGLRLRRHPRYWGQPPGFERLVIDTDVSGTRLAKSLPEARYGFAGYASVVLESAPLSERYRLVRNPSIFLRHLAADVSRETTPFCPGIPNPFRDPKVREAIHLALDRTTIVEAIGNGTRVANQLVPKAIFGFDPTLPPFAPNVERAQRLMAEAGFPDGFDVTLHRSRGFSVAAREVEEQLARIGVRATVVSLPSREFFTALADRKLSFWLTASGAATGDGLELLETSLHTPDASLGYGVDNYGDYSNPEVDAGIHEAAGLFNAVDRQRAIQTLMRRVLDDRVWIPLYFAENAYILDHTVDYVPRDDGYLHLSEIRPRLAADD